MATNTKGRNAGKRNSGNGRYKAKERGTRKDRDDYDEYKLSRKEQKKIKKAKRKRKLILILSVEFLLILVLCAGAFVLSKLGRLQNLGVDPGDVSTNEDMDENTAELLKGYTNIALFGLGSRTPGSLGEGELSDTIIIASINNETKEVRMVSVYRDTYLNRADDTYGKCNAAYSKGGPKQAMEMLNTNLDLNIKYYVSIDFTALIKTVDLLGGVEIDVKEEEVEAINSYMYETTAIAEKADGEVNPYNSFIEEPGLQTLYGVQATAYCRIRKVGNNDYERTERQRRVIEQIVEKAKSAGLGTINSMIDEVFPLVATNIPKTTLIGMAASMMSYELGETSGFPSMREGGIMIDGQDMVVPADLVANVEELHRFLFDEDDYYPSPTVLEINDRIIADTGVTAKETEGSSTE